MASASSSAPDWRTTRLGSVPFTLESRFTPVLLLGQGTYGLVCAAQVAGEAEQVAVKKITGVFNESNNIIEAKRTLREMILLRHIQHDNVCGLRYIMLPPPEHDVYLVSEKMDSDMQKIIQSEQPITDDHCRYFIYQMLRGLKYLHSASIAHRDLKPSNVLLNANCDLKITDFGLARAIEEDESSKMTQYVVTRWYRAPEILLLVRRYTTAVDLWSVGCILAELLRRQPLFPGRSYLHQLQLVIAQVGTPSAEALEDVDPKLAQVIGSMPRKPPRPLQPTFPEATAEALDLLAQLLQFSPSRRVTAEQALSHPYLAALHDEDDEPSHAEPFDGHDLEQRELDWPTVKELVRKEAQRYRQAAAPDADEPVAASGEAAGAPGVGSKRARENEAAAEPEPLRPAEPTEAEA